MKRIPNIKPQSSFVWLIAMLLAVAPLTTSCKKGELQKACVVGQFPGSIYKMKYPDCYPKSLWIEVLNDDLMGEDVTIATFNKAYDHPTEIKTPHYSNVVEAVFENEEFLKSYTAQDLAGKKIYFQYREATEEEIHATRPEHCYDFEELYQSYYKVPVVVITDWSFDDCPVGD